MDPAAGLGRDRHPRAALAADRRRTAVCLGRNAADPRTIFREAAHRTGGNTFATGYLLLCAALGRDCERSRPAAANAGRTAPCAQVEDLSADGRPLSGRRDVSVLSSAAERRARNTHTARTPRTGIHVRARGRTRTCDLRRLAARP